MIQRIVWLASLLHDGRGSVLCHIEVLIGLGLEHKKRAVDNLDAEVTENLMTAGFGGVRKIAVST